MEALSGSPVPDLKSRNGVPAQNAGETNRDAAAA